MCIDYTSVPLLKRISKFVSESDFIKLTDFKYDGGTTTQKYFAHISLNAHPRIKCSMNNMYRKLRMQKTAKHEFSNNKSSFVL